MLVTAAKILLLGTTVLAAYTDEFLQAFRNLGLDPWAGIEMDVAWGHATLSYGLHRPSIAGPIFVYRVCAHSPVAFTSRVQVLTHENLSPDQVLSAIVVIFLICGTDGQRQPGMLLPSIAHEDTPEIAA